MKCKVLLLSHAKLAEAFINTIEFVYGDTTGFGYINMPDPFDQMAYVKMIEDVVLENLDTGVLILTDLFGGSPFLTSSRIFKKYENVELIAGFNLAMLLEMAPMIESSEVLELKEIAMDTSQNSIIDIRERLK